MSTSVLPCWAHRAWVPCKVVEGLEGSHGTHALARRGEAVVHVELRAVAQQVGVGDIYGHGHPVGTGVGSEAGPTLEASPRAWSKGSSSAESGDPN